MEAIHPTFSYGYDSYEWADPDVFTKNAEEAADTYMHMVAARLRLGLPK